MVIKTKSMEKIALVIVLIIFIALFSSISDYQWTRSLSFSQGTLQQTWPYKTSKQTKQETTSATITCDRSNTNYDVCAINGSCNLDLKTGTITLMVPTSAPLVEKIRPYPRKAETWLMPKIKELTLTSGYFRVESTSNPSKFIRSCDISHDSPAIVFSAGGYTGNIYHAFIDGFIPLFITANSVYPNRNFILVVTDSKQWWMSKYIDILGAFSKHKTILLGREENDSITHCFTSATVGLISHGPMTIDPTLIPNSKSLVDFHNLLDKAYSSNLSTLKIKKPRIILVSRYGNIGRVILNEKEIKEMLEDVGFEVITFRPSKTTDMSKAYKLISSSHGMIGAHGAALTHLLFLRPGSVLVQVVPIGLGWVAKTCFESPAKAMKLEYSEYRVSVEESSLVKKYSRDDLVLKDPIAFRGMGWNLTKMNVYLKEQDVSLDVNRFRKHMNIAYNKAKSFTDING